ncbi:hypothetical protein ONZ51_g12393 [Trametes cubensis]|uniref:Uncharacterized protein n=1 Tax=Trametes cubensis TaxID=1111947 RepID=A0AAD7TGM7_9APHY|nr:hypothetical protein ONZ51_g12393 [Trametes cubensis]
MSDLLPEPLGNHCPSCHKHYATAQGVSAHLSHRPECRRAFKAANAANRPEAATRGLINNQSAGLEEDRGSVPVPAEASQHYPEYLDDFAPDLPLPDPLCRNFHSPPIDAEPGDNDSGSWDKRRHVEVEEVPDEAVADFSAAQFTRCLYDFLFKLAIGNPVCLDLLMTPLQETSRVAAYKQCKLCLPIVHQVSPQMLVNSIHASPARASPGPLKPPVPAKMSTVLARDPAEAVSSPALVFDHTQPLRGLCVARVRMIFDLPKVYDAKSFGVTEPLAYVEWFTSFHVVDSTTGMQIDRRPVQGDVLDSHTAKFYVNAYLRHHDFVLFRHLATM